MKNESWVRVEKQFWWEPTDKVSSFLSHSQVALPFIHFFHSFHLLWFFFCKNRRSIMHGGFFFPSNHPFIHWALFRFGYCSLEFFLFSGGDGGLYYIFCFIVSCIFIVLYETGKRKVVFDIFTMSNGFALGFYFNWRVKFTFFFSIVKDLVRRRLRRLKVDKSFFVWRIDECNSSSILIIVLFKDIWSKYKPHKYLFSCKHLRWESAAVNIIVSRVEKV